MCVSHHHLCMSSQWHLYLMVSQTCLSLNSLPSNLKLVADYWSKISFSYFFIFVYNHLHLGTLFYAGCALLWTGVLTFSCNYLHLCTVFLTCSTLTDRIFIHVQLFAPWHTFSQVPLSLGENFRIHVQIFAHWHSISYSSPPPLLRVNFLVCVQLFAPWDAHSLHPHLFMEQVVHYHIHKSHFLN